MTEVRKILVCPLDWGLGHATRSIPIIRDLLNRNCVVYIAGSGKSLTLLKKEFPGLKWIYLPGYRIRYARKPLLFLILFLQLPFFMFSFFRENYLLGRIQRKEKFHAIISDNRYGLFTSLAKTVFISHQLKIILPCWLKMFEKVTHRLITRLVNRFDVCWIPDMPGSIYSGNLSLARKELRNARFAGLLSRFSKTKRTGDKEFDFEIVAILSGPEPARSRFEKILEKQLPLSGRKTLLIRGLPDKQDFKQNGNQFKVNHLPTDIFLEVLQNARYIICRSGYSGIMDLLVLQKPALLVPTPGQTEQEYLAKHLQEKGVFPFLEQQDFELSKAIERLNSFEYEFSRIPETDLLEEAINRLMELKE